MYPHHFKSAQSTAGLEASEVCICSQWVLPDMRKLTTLVLIFILQKYIYPFGNCMTETL